MPEASEPPERHLLSTPPPREPHITPYPAAPWHAHGRAWVGLFSADRATNLPDGMMPLLGGRWRVVGLVRYLPGSTLTYDELFSSVPVRAGGRIGLYVDAMYVNDLSALWGGRRIWGLPKELARFSWAGDRCVVSDSGGPIATLQVNRHVSWLPSLPSAIPAFGTFEQPEGQTLLLTASLTARLGWAGLRLESWGPRFPYRLPSKPVLAVGCKPFTATFPPPHEVRLVSGSARAGSLQTGSDLAPTRGEEGPR